MKKFKLKKPIKSDSGEILNELDLKEEEDVTGVELFDVVDAESKSQKDVIAYLTGLSTKEIYQIKPRDYAVLLEHVGKILT